MGAIVGHRQRPIGGDGDSDGAAPCLTVEEYEAGEEILVLATGSRGVVAWDADDFINAPHRFIPRAVFGRGYIASVLMRELAPDVERNSQRRIVRMPLVSPKMLCRVIKTDIFSAVNVRRGRKSPGRTAFVSLAQELTASLVAMRIDPFVTYTRTRRPSRDFTLCRASASTGFTLIELMVVISVAGVLTALAVPAFKSFIMNDRDAAQINSLVASFNYARNEAVKQNIAGGITVCASTDALICSGTAWSGGWIVWNSNLTGCSNAKCVPLQTVPALAGANTVTATGAATTGIVFASSGMVTAPGAIKICDSRGATYAHNVEVNATGRIAASQTPGVAASGGALACP